MCNTTIKHTLEVHQVDRLDVYRDIARIHKNRRGGIKEGKICKLSVNGKSKLLIMRGLKSGEENYIRLDELTRDYFGVEKNNHYDFTIKPVCPLWQIWWACNSSESALRVAAWLGVVSVILGALSCVP